MSTHPRRSDTMPLRGLRMLGAVLMFVLLLPAAAHAQNTSSDADRRAALQARRDSLEAAVLEKFVERLARELRLDGGQREHVHTVMKAGSERRHQLLRESAHLRARMFRAVRTDGTSDAEFLRLVEESRRLREREHAIWEEDMQTLSRVLSPRQRIQFLISWADFHEDMREVIARELRRSQRDPR